jgi:hypothetical protein
MREASKDVVSWTKKIISEHVTTLIGNNGYEHSFLRMKVNGLAFLDMTRENFSSTRVENLISSCSPSLSPMQRSGSNFQLQMKSLANVHRVISTPLQMLRYKIGAFLP